MTKFTVVNFVIEELADICYYLTVMSSMNKVLEGLAAPFTEGKLTIGEIIYHPYKLLYTDLVKIYKDSAINQAFWRARNKGFVKKRIIKGKAYFAITELGKQKLASFKGKFDLGFESKGEDWDGKYRIFLFDIPEKDRIIRDTLRRKLKRFGFVGWQKSVWISKENIAGELREFVKKANLEDHALIIETNDLGNKKLEYLMSAHKF
ncbi:MAG: hypothetical protein WD231_04825 [Candidatus Woykebacteria bacterium]